MTRKIIAASNRKLGVDSMAYILRAVMGSTSAGTTKKTHKKTVGFTFLKKFDIL